MAAGTRKPSGIGWSDESLELSVQVDEYGVARLARLAAGSAAPSGAGSSSEPGTGMPLIDLVLAGEGRSWSGRRYCESTAGPRMWYRGHEETGAASAGGANRWHQLRIDLEDPATGLRAEVFYRMLMGGGTVRAWVHLVNGGPAAVTVESVTSLLCGGLGTSGGPAELEALDVLWAENDWLAESRWQRRALRDALPDLDRSAHHADPRGRFGVTSVGTWSSGTYLPMGALVDRTTGHAWVWQIEHNGAWHWQAGEYGHHGGQAGTSGREPARAGHRGGVYIALLGPADAEHHWRLTLAPGETFSTVPAAVAVSEHGLDDALGRLTGYRRAIRRPHPDHQRLPVIFNDYMNTLMGDPTTERLLPLIGAAAAAGAEYFCIDAGWYAERGESWWDTVGVWQPSASRFPGGIAEVMNSIRAEGMVPGLWLEPEVVGVRSRIAQRLPDDAFFARGGTRVVENGRYHLDLRHPAAVEHLDQAVDFLADELGVGYFKFDYNINAGPGTDSGKVSSGAGLLAHNRAHLDWLDAALDRHPGLVIENCASGGMRMDYALLSRLQLQSTSDQQDLFRYAPVAAAAPVAVTPEQGASWAYPQPSFTDDEIAFTLCNALLGRVHLSGHLDRMSPSQHRLVAEAIAVYKQIRADVATSVPFWPLGLPGWDDSWLALGLRTQSATYLTIWRRGHAGQGTADRTVRLPLPALCGRPAEPEVLYPRGPAAAWAPDSGLLTVMLNASPAACLIRLRP